MENRFSLLFAPLVLLLTACSTHYSASSHSRYHGHHGGHVSVGVHGHGHGGGKILGALVVGGIIGHILTEAAHDEGEVEDSPRVVTQNTHSDDTDEVVNGYPIEPRGTYPQDNDEANRWYQLGEDGSCYLMETVNGKEKIVSLVPPYACG